MERLCQAFPEDRQSVVVVAREPSNGGQMSGSGSKSSGAERQPSLFRGEKVRGAAQMSACCLTNTELLTRPSQTGEGEKIQQINLES